MPSYTVSNLVSKKRFQKISSALFFLTLGLALLTYAVENGAPNSKIHSLFDAVWYAVTTVASVGFGDMVPVTTLGRIFGMILEIVGVGLFSTIFVIIGITMTESQDRYQWRRVNQKLEEIDKKLDSLHKSHQYLVKSHDEHLQHHHK